LRQLLNVAYILLTENADKKARQRLDMDLGQRPKTGMLGRPNTVRGSVSKGDDALRALFGSPMAQAGRR